MLFSELDYDSEFDAAWACSSLLHVPKAEMPDIIKRICKALKADGFFYASYKYGERERENAGRLFSDYSENDLPVLTGYSPELSLFEYWISEDVRPDCNRRWAAAADAVTNGRLAVCQRPA